MYLAKIDTIYGCEFTYVGNTEKEAIRGLVEKIIWWRANCYGPLRRGHHSRVPHP